MVSGRVVDEVGVPREGVTVTLCHGACRIMDTDGAGAFLFEEVDANTYSLHFTTFGEGGLADVLLALDVADGELVELSADVPMAVTGALTVVTAPREVEVAPSVWLDIDPAAVTLPPFGAEQLELAAATPTGLPPLLPADDVLGIWYLAPFDSQVDPGMGFRATNTWGLAPNEELELWASSYADYAWVHAGTVTVSPDGAEVVGGSVPVISTLVLARPPTP